MAFSKLLLVLFLVTLSIFREISFTSSSFTEKQQLPSPSSSSSSDKNGCNVNEELKSTISVLQSIIKEKNQELVIKEEKIKGLELLIREKSHLFDSELESPLKHASEAEEKVYNLEKQVFGLKQEVELQHKRRLEVENRAEIADKKVAELSSKLENIGENWFSSKLEINSNKTQLQAYLLTLWNQHLSPTLHITLQKVSQNINQLKNLSEPHIKSLNSKWIPSIRDACVTLTIYLKPKVQYLTDKSIEMLSISKQALTPHFIQGFEVSCYYLEVIRTHTHPYTTQVLTIAKPHLEKAQVVLEPYTYNVRNGFKKLVNSTKIYHQQAQEMLKNNEITKPVATMDLAWVAATAFVGFPLIFTIKLLSAISNPKGKKRYSHKEKPVVGYRRAKRRLPHQ